MSAEQDNDSGARGGDHTNRTRGAARLRRGLQAAGLAGLLLALLLVRVVSGAASELRQGDRYRRDGDVAAAVVHYRRAARWYAPGSPYHVAALAKLGALGKDAEEHGDTASALSAYRAIRAAIMATRSFYMPEAERLAAADQRIASLMAALPAPPGDVGKSYATLRAEHLTLLSRDPAPRLGFTLLLLAGFIVWVSGAFGFSLRAIDRADRFVPREARRWGTLIVVGFGMFVLGMSLA